MIDAALSFGCSLAGSESAADSLTARETQHDAARDPLTAPIGTTMRLRMQTNDALLAELKAKGLRADALRVPRTCARRALRIVDPRARGTPRHRS
jgi:hypothetical protein